MTRITFSPALMPSRRRHSSRALIRPRGRRSLPAREVTVNSPEKERWKKEAAEYARFEGQKPEQWGHKRATKGGWTWENLNDT